MCIYGHIYISASSFLDHLSGAAPSHSKGLSLNGRFKNEHAWFVDSRRSNIWMGFYSEPCPSTFTGQHRVKSGHVNCQVLSLKDPSQCRSNLVYLLPPDPGHTISAIIPILQESVPTSTSPQNFCGWILCRCSSIGCSSPSGRSLSALQD